MKEWIFGLAALIGVVFLFLQVYFFLSRGLAMPPEGWIAYEIVILIALSVMLAVLTISLAVLGVLGYQTIRSAAEQKATERAEAIAREVARETAQPIAMREVESWREAFGAGRYDAGDAATDALTRALSSKGSEGRSDGDA